MMSDAPRFAKLCAKLVGEMTQDWRALRGSRFDADDTHREAERILAAAEAVAAAARVVVAANAPTAPAPNEYHTHNHYAPKPDRPDSTPSMVEITPRTFR